MVPLILSTLFVMAVSLWAVWRAAKPLNLFTEAAERLGRDVNAPNLPETGPGDVRRAAQAFNLMQERLRAFVNDRTQMLAAISHDLRTPITRIQLRTEFIDDEEIRLKILLDLKEMETMIAATLAFARDEAMAEERTAFDLAAVLRSLCDAAATGPAKAAFDGPDTLTIVAGPVGIRRLFANLIGNAVTFGHTALVSAQVEGETVLVNVDDEGPGIPDAEMGAVFRPFYRLERSRNRETGGVGLGLAIARSIARAHGGDVTLVNRPEGGLRATVRLPALSVASAAA
ncbi:MAG: HAMP domain-containing protein [Rhodospirillales bacterium]|nr:HAMP domain-containing protein [Rhodospirillales bacterium]